MQYIKCDMKTSQSEHKHIANIALPMMKHSLLQVNERSIFRCKTYTLKTSAKLSKTGSVDIVKVVIWPRVGTFLSVSEPISHFTLVSKGHSTVSGEKYDKIQQKYDRIREKYDRIYDNCNKKKKYMYVVYQKNSQIDWSESGRKIWPMWQNYEICSHHSPVSGHKYDWSKLGSVSVEHILYW